MEYGELAEVPVAGVPLSTPVAVLNVTPLGSAPFSLNAGAGKPDAVTVKVPGVPSPNVAMLALVMMGTWPTVSVRPCVASGVPPLFALRVMEKVPAVPAAGLPLSTPVDEFKVTPFGRAQVSLK